MITVKITSPVPIILAGQRVLPGETHTVNLGQYLQAKEVYPDGLKPITPIDEVVATEVVVEPVKEAKLPHDESVQVSPTTRKRRTAN